jgi:hypothetical protein
MKKLDCKRLWGDAALQGKHEQSSLQDTVTLQTFAVKLLDTSEEQADRRDPNHTAEVQAGRPADQLVITKRYMPFGEKHSCIRVGL